jgi:hypothetical protein
MALALGKEWMAEVVVDVGGEICFEHRDYSIRHLDSCV